MKYSEVTTEKNEVSWLVSTIQGVNILLTSCPSTAGVSEDTIDARGSFFLPPLPLEIRVAAEDRDFGGMIETEQREHVPIRTQEPDIPRTSLI